MNDQSEANYIYTYACHEDERELCRLELHSLLGNEPSTRHVISSRCIEPSRSPFIHERLTVLIEGSTLEELEERTKGLHMGNDSFKLRFLDADYKESYEGKRQIERQIGAVIIGQVDMKQPKRLLGITYAGGRWVLGDCKQSEAVWLQHGQKPRQYSTALSTRVARATANIALPEPEGRRLIDPCCGIGTVLIEAL